MDWLLLGWSEKVQEEDNATGHGCGIPACSDAGPKQDADSKYDHLLQKHHRPRLQNFLPATDQLNGPGLKGHRVHCVAWEGKKLNGHKSLRFCNLKETCITRVASSV